MVRQKVRQEEGQGQLVPVAVVGGRQLRSMYCTCERALPNAWQSHQTCLHMHSLSLESNHTPTLGYEQCGACLLLYLLLGVAAAPNDERQQLQQAHMYVVGEARGSMHSHIV